MNAKIESHVSEYLKSKGFSSSRQAVIACIREGVTWSGNAGSRRHWDDIKCVSEIDGMFIMFDGACTTGDDSPEDKGWEFDENSICEAEPYTETVTKYRAKKETP